MTARLAEAQSLWERAIALANQALELQRSIVDNYGAAPSGKSANDILTALTPREREVLQLVAQGLPNRLIARTLGIAEKTVKNHLYAIFAKLDVSDRTQAALFAVTGTTDG